MDFKRTLSSDLCFDWGWACICFRKTCKIILGYRKGFVGLAPKQINSKELNFQFSDNIFVFDSKKRWDRKCFFLVNVGLSTEDIFLTNFYGLYFSNNYTYYKLQSFTCWPSVGSCIYNTMHTYTALQPMVVTIVPWGHHEPAKSPIGQTLLRVQFRTNQFLYKDHISPRSTKVVVEKNRW